MKNKTLLFLMILCWTGGAACAQQTLSDSGFVKIERITLEGNRKTRNSLILRELEFQVGDSIPAYGLDAVFERNAHRLLNLNLFSVVHLTAEHLDSSERIVVHIHMTESWYLLPVPLFALADRNFNVWWNEFHGSLRRINFGLDLTHNNLSGYADVLKMKFETGYNNRYEISYRLPPLNRPQTFSLQTAVAYSRQHEVAYSTEGNKLLFRKDPKVWNITQLFAGANFIWRPKLNTSQAFALEYHDYRASDSIAVILNPDFFLNSATRQKYFSVVYNISSDRRDIRPYPLHGWFARAELRQNGLLGSDNLHMFRAFAEYSRYFPVFKNLYADLAVKGRLTLPRKQPPYFNNQALGYGGNFVRGYEYYVSDGLDFGVVKTALHYEFLNRVFHFGRLMPFKSFREFPLKLYLSFNNDAGISNDPYYTAKNPLVNRLLYGYGFGFDVVALYNKTARFEYSWNDLGQGALYIRIDTGF